MFIEPQVQGFGVDHGRGKIPNLVEVPHQQLGKHRVVRVLLNGAKQGHPNQFAVVFDGGQPKIAVEAVLDGPEVIGLGAEQGHVGIDHAFEVAPHALEVGQFVIEACRAQFLCTLVGGEGHVQLVELDEGVGQGYGGRPAGLQVFERLHEGLQGLLSTVEVEVQRPEVHEGRGSRVFVAALEPLLHHFLRRVKVVQREQRRVVHGVHGVGLVLLPNALEVELGLRVTAFVVVEFRELQIRLTVCRLGRDPAQTREQEPHLKQALDNRHGLGWVHDPFSLDRVAAHSARLTRMRLSMEARVAASSSMPREINRSVSATARPHCSTALSSRAACLSK